MGISRNIIIAILVLITVKSFAQGVKYEAENAQLAGVKVVRQISGYSGDGYVTGFDNDGDKVVFNFDQPEAGKYQLYIGYAAPNGDKNNFVYVNGINLGNLLFAKSNKFLELDAGKISLNIGSNIISIEKSWGWFELDYIRIDSPKESAQWNISNTPVNQNASPEAVSMLKFLVHNFGKTTFAGQYQAEEKSYSASNSEFDYIKKLTGKYPALYGNDLIDYSTTRVEHGSSSSAIEDVIDWYEIVGGMVTLSWHWNAPTDLYNTDENPWWSGFYTRATSFDISKAIDPASENYELLLRDIDAIAVQLKRLQPKNIPVLWRPLHEAEGGWFWWGAKGPDACKQLWHLLYDRLTNFHQINNLIWVWTTTDSQNALTWYPGDEYVDILGVDVYLNDGDYSPSSTMFDNLRNMFEGKKLLTMSEDGTIPHPQKMFENEAYWSYFCTWSGDFIFGGKQNSADHLKEVFNHELITTADELPSDWNTFVGIEDIEASTNNQFRAYPNPFNNEINLNFNHILPESVTILDSSGNTVIFIEGDQITDHFSIPMKQYPSGIYLLRIKNKQNNVIQKIMKY